jgi:hypothetical protein
MSTLQECYCCLMQVLLAVPALRDFYTLPSCGQQLRKGPIGSALQELVQTAYGAAGSSGLASGCMPPLCCVSQPARWLCSHP